MVCKHWHTPAVHNISQHYMNDACVYAYMQRAHAFIRNMVLEQVVTNIVAHVDTVIAWGMKQVYTKITLKPTDVTNLFRLNRFN